MPIIERHVQYKVKSADKYKEWEKSWSEIESRLGGFPPKRRLSLFSGADYVGTLVWEREWDSIAAMEAAYMRSFADPEGQKMETRYEAVLEGERVELYFLEES